MFEECYRKLVEEEEYMGLYLLEKADLFIYSLEFAEMAHVMREEHKSVLKKVCVIFFKIIDERSRGIKKWLQTSIGQVSGLIIRIE